MGRARRSTLHGWLIAVAAILFFVPTANGQTRREIIRGRVATDSGRALAGADIIVTMAPNREVFRTTSDSAGGYELAIAAGTGDYLVYIGAIGRRALRKRVTRVANESTFVVDARLAPDVASVAAVRTTARRPRPPRGDDAPSRVGGLTAEFADVAGALSPDQMGDFAAIAATIPGIATTPDNTISAFGLDAAQNRATLNGLTFDGGSLPRDLPIRTRVATSVYDPTVGGFGGALVAVDILPGGSLTLSTGHVTLDAPQLQAADATARRLGQRYTRAQLSYGRRGELSQDRWVYSAAAEASRRSTFAPSILSANGAELTRLGVSTDSAARFLDLVNASGVPVRVPGLDDDFSSTGFNGVFRIDRAPSFTLGGAPVDTKARFAIVGAGSYSRSQPSFASALTPPSHTARSESGNGSLQLILSQYFGKDASYLSETKTAVSFSEQRLRPYVLLPGGSVRVRSQLDDGSAGISTLQFGGSTLRSDTRGWRWEASNEFSFNPANHTLHRIKFFTQAQVDGYRQASDANGLGTFSYNSLADLAANTPASYSRTVFTPVRTGRDASGAFAIADFWNPTPEWQFVFGPRLEWNAFLDRPADNPAITQAFGVHTNVVPGGVHVSPRFGFSWLYPGARAAGRQSGFFSSLGGQYMPPRGVLRGGFGEFRAPYAPSLISNAMVNTGLAGTTTERLMCIGPDAPTADWSDYLANPTHVPATCDGSATVFSDATPSIELFDPSFTTARRWTGNLSWSSAYKQTFYTLDASYSLNVNQPGIVDLNFADRPAFQLDNEDGRPVYVPETAIDPATGIVSPVPARVSSEFGRVASRRSDLRSHVAQATLSIIPYLPRLLTRFMVSGSYTYSRSRRLTRGFDGNTFGDPLTPQWASGFTPDHQIRFRLGYRFTRLHSIFTTYWNLQSGFPYTPLVAGDINGDGLANDRAFVFRPESAPSAGVASGMTSLLASTTPEARDCLRRQLGSAAGRDSCTRPWTAMMNARLDWQHRFGDTYHYVNISLAFSNPLGGLDQLLHGGNKLHGWGLPATPDPTLYFVRGFDQSARRFVYEVNPRFGNTRPSVAALYNPFRVTLDVSFSLNGNVARRQVEIYLRPTRSAPGVRPPADTILRRLRSTGAFPIDPYRWIIQNADSLLLTRDQVATVTAAQKRRDAAIDSMYKALANELASLPPKYDIDDVTKRTNDAQRRIFEWSDSDRAELRRTLTPIQTRLLPVTISRMLNESS
jgi:hypothetical protein